MGRPPGFAGDRDLPWINPIGGLGDMLMLSGVLKQAADRDPSRRFHMVRRSAYRGVFESHPAIEIIGSPPPGARILETDYWTRGIGAGPKRPYQILARMFDLDTPIEEILYFPGKMRLDPVLERTVPWQERNVMLAAGSESPRKMMDPRRWDLLAGRLAAAGLGVFHLGTLKEARIRNSYSLLGLTSPGELLAVLARADAVVCIDTFAMHAAHLAGSPAVVLWGPTDPDIYGYPEQRHFRAEPICEIIDQCIGPRAPEVYTTFCPRGPEHCLDRIPLEEVERAVVEMAQRSGKGSGP